MSISQQITEFQERVNYKQLPQFYQCGICDCYHPAEWNGDCRDDANKIRFGST